VPEIATITGRSLKDVEAILDAHYLSRTTKLAVSAVAKRECAAAATGWRTKIGKQSNRSRSSQGQVLEIIEWAHKDSNLGPAD
jgi:hypothetical protein